MAETSEERSILRGRVARITYQEPTGRYTVVRLEVGGAPPVTVVGAIFPVSEGEEIKVDGSWRMHPRYGLQFQAERWEKLEPATLEGIERYLGSGLIKGIGPTYAKRLVAAFGLDTLRVLSEEPQRLRQVEGIGRVRARQILDAWEKQKGLREVMVFLQGHGVTSALALKIYRAYGQGAIARVKENPYCLADELHGVGFVLADRIAQGLGISGDFPLRLQAGILYLLARCANEGHCYLPSASLLQQAGALLGVDEEAVQGAMERLAQRGEVVLERPAAQGEVRVYPKELHAAELRVASALKGLLGASFSLALPRALEAAQAEIDFLLEAEQRAAVQQALRQKVLIITGGPGTGKTTLLNSLLALLRRFKITFALAAPTGRAAKRMGEATGEEAKTLHRLLEYNPRERAFQKREDNPLEAEVVIVDEASMVDLPLMDSLLRAVEPKSHLVLIGDVDQLPSVGPGSVLRDLIDSGALPVAVLRRIFRQAEESLIVVNAHRILQGEPLLFGPEGERRDFVFVVREEPEAILETVKTLVQERIPRSLRLDPIQSVQVLTPMHRGLLGTVHLNQELQKLLNPAGDAVERGERLFRLGDKVMQQRNDYDKGVFNGDLGRIVRIDREEGELHVDFYGREIAYEMDELDELSLAYATSIHKSQGSEYPAVVIPLHTSHYMMLHRSILYTAITRGKELVVLVGSKKAVAMAIKNIRVEKRFTGLRERLAEV